PILGDSASGAQSPRFASSCRPSPCCPFDTTGKTPLRLFINDATCPAARAKIFAFPKHRSYDLKKPARLDTGDVRPSSPAVRRVVRDGEACRGGAPRRRVKRCGRVPPMQGTSPGLRARGDGGKKAGSPGRSRSSRKTIAQGVPDDFGVPV